MAKQDQYLHIAQQKYRVIETEILTAQVNLDASNPRISYMADLAGKAPKTNIDIAALLLEDNDIRRLYSDIKQQEGLHDPILVNNDNMIIEGNSRAACYLTLQARDKSVKGRWDKIPCRFLLDQMPADKVAVLQARYHVLGKNAWRAYAQAEHFYLLQTKHGKTSKEIHDETGMHEKTIDDMINTCKTMKAHAFGAGKKSSTDQAVRKYSYFFEFQKDSDPTVVEFRKKKENREQFATWVDEGKFEKGADVRQLPSILSDSCVRAAFESKGIGGAKPVLSKVDPTSDSALYRKIKNLNTALRTNFSREVAEIKENSPRRKLLEALSSTIEKMIEASRK